MLLLAPFGRSAAIMCNWCLKLMGKKVLSFTHLFYSTWQETGNKSVNGVVIISQMRSFAMTKQKGMH